MGWGGSFYYKVGESGFFFALNNAKFINSRLILNGSNSFS